jgi:hypothetical protein
VHRAAEGKKARGDLIPTIVLWAMEELNGERTARAVALGLDARAQRFHREALE